jgi:predicted nucleic acid-binding protein
MIRGFLLDTNVPSELTRIKPDLRVARWLEAANDNLLYLSVITIGEFCKGFTVHPEQHRRSSLREWLDNTLRPWFDTRTLPVSEAIAERWGILEGQCQLLGQPISGPEGLIAATALEHDLRVVTRNVKDFAGLGVEILNPWDT